MSVEREISQLTEFRLDTFHLTLPAYGEVGSAKAPEQVSDWRGGHRPRFCGVAAKSILCQLFITCLKDAFSTLKEVSTDEVRSLRRRLARLTQ